MSSLLIWFWINDNQESCPAIRCPLSPQPPSQTSSARRVARLTLHSTSPLSSLEFFYSTTRRSQQSLSQPSSFDVCLISLRQCPHQSLSLLIFHTMSLCVLVKQSVIHSCCCSEHMHSIEMFLSSLWGINSGAEASASVRPSGEKNGWRFGTVRPQQVTSTWVRIQSCIWVFGYSVK